MDETTPRAHHDMGGIDRFMCLPVDIEAHALSDFDKQVDAIRQIVSLRGLMSVDELRRGIEALPEDEYHAVGYYGRWIRSIVATLVRKGAIDEAAFRAALPTP